MATNCIVFVCIQAVILQTVYGQCVNRVIPNCGCSNTLPIEVSSYPNILLNQYPSLPSTVLLNSAPCNYRDTVVQVPQVAPTTTIIQDSTVANNLANALQLLVVSNLLSNTLPAQEVMVPGCGCGYAAPLPLEVVSPLTSFSPCGGCGGPSFSGLGYNYLF